MADKYEKQLASLRNEESKYTSALESSPTALGGEQMPSDTDLGNQIRLQNIKNQITKVNDKKVQERWFGPKTKEVPGAEGASTGIIGTTVDYLSRPLYGIAGALEHALGKGTKSSLQENVAANITTGKRTVGDLLKRQFPNAPYLVTAPLGFALDVTLDPINWATAGTTALIPRVVAGATRAATKGGLGAGVRAAGAGLESSFIGRSAYKLASKTAGALPEKVGGNLSETILNRPLKAADTYDELTGTNIMDKVRQGPGVGFGEYRTTLGDLVKKAAETTPWGKKLFSTLDYDNERWLQNARIRDSLLKNLGLPPKVMEDFVQAKLRGDDAAAMATLSDFEKTIKPASKKLDLDSMGEPMSEQEMSRALEELSKTGALRNIEGAAPKVVEEIDDVGTILKDPSIGYTTDAAENGWRLALEDAQGKIGKTVTPEMIKEVIDSGAFGESGIKWFDNMMNRVRSLKYTTKNKRVVEYGKNTLDAYQSLMGIFRSSKVGLSPSAWTNSVIGNPSMASALGLNIADPKFLGRVAGGVKVATGWHSSDKVLQELFSVPGIGKFIETDPTTYARTTGLSPTFLDARRKSMEVFLRKAKEDGFVGKDASVDAIADDLDEAASTIANATGGGDAARMEALTGYANKFNRGRSPSMEYALKAAQEGGALPTSMSSNEFIEAANLIRRKASEENAGWVWKALDKWMTKPMEAYEGIDQSYKVGTIMYLTLDGVTDTELNRIRRFIKMDPGKDLTRVKEAGKYRYQLSPAKAVEAANEIYLNYNAMPAAVKMLRNLPLLGGPFTSFMYGMALKTGNTLVHNPALFNKITFGLNDFGGTETPLEKQALNSKYYSYLKDPSMFRVPTTEFFNQYPLYVNTANMIPFYTFNMFTPPERRYKELLPNALVQTLDRSPLLKDPVGAVIFDNIILPTLLKESQPVGSFGQPVYPYNSTLGEKAAYTARALADIPLPGFAPIAGLVTPESVTEAVPSYRWRQLARATRGQNQYGKSSKESATSRTLRSLAGGLGIPVQAPVDLTYIASDIKKNVKK